MSNYKQVHNGILRKDTGATIPLDLANRDYQEFLASGETPDEADVSPPPRILSVTPRQFRLALNATGMRANIEAYVAAGSQDMKDTWEFATVIERNSPLIVAGAAELNLTEAQIDDLFTLAATL